MTEDNFWTLIDIINNPELDLLDEDDYSDELLSPLIDVLSKLSVSEIEGFEEILSFSLYKLDGEQFANNAGKSGQSGDGFLYARCWVVAKGKEYYENVLSDPQNMPKYINQWCESLLYVSSKAWAINTGQDEEDWDYTPSYDYETGSNEALW